MLDKYYNDQEVVTKLLKKSLTNNKLVQAYLFCCDDIEYIFNYAKDFAKEIINLSGIQKEVLKNIFDRIDKEQYTELKIVTPNGNFIKKEQLIELQNSVVNKPTEGNKIIYIIKNCEKLNSSSANSILKFLEEPADDIIAILLTDNINMVMDTIKSRCQILNFNNVKSRESESNKLKKYIINENNQKNDEELDSIISSSFDIIVSIENKGKNTFIYMKKLIWDIYKTNDDILLLFNIMLYLYTDALYMKLGKNVNYMASYEDKVSFIDNKNSVDSIVNKICIIESLKNELKVNVNNKLLFDKMVIELSEV
ncbi:MAG: hypothetical protein J6J17_00185 [Bacilli bacterium]|nr:hypothetical protein [Bacilli bacterium]